MIKVEKGHVKFDGNALEIAADFACAANTLKKFAIEELSFDDESANKFVKETAELGLLSDDDRKKKAKEAKKEIFKDIKRFFFEEDEEDE